MPATPHTNRMAAAFALAALAAAGLCGCTGHKRPTARVSDATMGDRSPEAAVVDFVIETANPNAFELPMREILYTLSIDGRRVFSGTRAALATMPRGGTQRITIPAVVPLGEDGVTADLHAYTLTGRVRYSLPSQLADVLFDAKISRPSVPISYAGEIDLR